MAAFFISSVISYILDGNDRDSYIRLMRFLVIFLACHTVLLAGEEKGNPPANRDYNLIIKSVKPLSDGRDKEDNFTLKNSSELKTVASGMIRLYQVLLSSQDSPTCNYSPSCSRFTSAAIRKAGIIKGTLLGADRLLRCHRWTKRHYMKTHNLQADQIPLHIDDPPEKYID